MEITIIAHTYAPELNEARISKNGIFKGAIRCPNVKTIKAFRNAFFKKAVFKKTASIKSVYSESDFKWLNREMSGSFTNYVDVLAAKKQLLARGNAGAVLFDGSIMPKNNVICTTQSLYL